MTILINGNFIRGEKFSLKGVKSMHSFMRRIHGSASKTSSKQTKGTKGLILDQGWRYDLMIWFMDTFPFRGQMRELRRRTADLARIQPGEQVLDVGCGTGTLALEVFARVGRAGRVVAIDPGREQIAHARSKAARHNIPAEFQVGVIEQLPFPNQTFDVVFSTLMMHHLPAPLKRQGLAEIARVLKPSGRLVIADFTRKQERAGQAARFHAGGSSMHDLAVLVQDAGFERPETQEMQPAPLSSFPGASIVCARKSSGAIT
jgi:ubiquinone/menaquinone biosynthesis C-methylase UbiE